MTRITLTTQALKKAAQDLSTPDHSCNHILNTLARAICGPKKNWGFLTSAPSGHYVQPGVELWVLDVPERAPLMFASQSDALAAFAPLAASALNASQAVQDLEKGRAFLEFEGTDPIAVTLRRVGKAADPIVPNTDIGKGPVFSYPCDKTTLSRLIATRNVLICGVTGSGKTTTLKGCLSRHIKTAFIEPAHELSESSFLYRAGPGLEDCFQKAWALNPKRLVLGELINAQGFEGLRESVKKGISITATMQARDVRSALDQLVSWAPETFSPFSKQVQVAATFDAVVFIDPWKEQKLHVSPLGLALPGFKDA